MNTDKKYIPKTKTFYNLLSKKYNNEKRKKSDKLVDDKSKKNKKTKRDKSKDRLDIKETEEMTEDMDDDKKEKKIKEKKDKSPDKEEKGEKPDTDRFNTESELVTEDNNKGENNDNTNEDDFPRRISLKIARLKG